MDQVRNGNRWHVIAVDPETNRVAAERLTDHVRATFEGDYLTEHITLGYAVTVHSAQGVTTDTAHAIIADTSTRSMAYVAMSRGRDTNHAYLYTRDDTEHDQTDPLGTDEIHQLRRGTRYAAAHNLRAIAAKDDRPRTMHAIAQTTHRELLPDIIGRVQDRHDRRAVAREAAWREHATTMRNLRTAYERMNARMSSAERARHVGGLEL